MTTDISSEQIRNHAIELGFEHCGMIPVGEMAGYLDRLHEREKHFPQSGPFLERFAGYAHPESVFPWARSIVVAVWNYGQYRIPDSLQGMVGKSFLSGGPGSPMENALELMECFFKEHSIQYTTHDGVGLTAYRYAAERAGLGIVRKNNFFYTETGSWNIITTWMIDAKMELREESHLTSCPQSCRHCRQFCPTGALSCEYAMNPLACVACLTTFTGRDMPNDPNRKNLGRWIYGCDTCQDVCPFNKKFSSGTKELPGMAVVAELMKPEHILVLDEHTWRTRLQPQFWYLKPDELWKLKVNALNFMHNNWKEDYIKLVHQAASDESEPVREMAGFVLANHTW